MSAAPEEVRFAKNASIMVEAIQDGVNRVRAECKDVKTIDPLTMAFIVGVIQNFDKHHLIQGFIDNSHRQCWDCIKKRDEAFFINNAGSIFQYLPAEKVNLFKDLYQAKDVNGNNVVSDSLKEQIWSLFDAMIKISIKYIHKMRSPYASTGPDGGIINAYAYEFFGEVDVVRHAQIWGLALEFHPTC